MEELHSKETTKEIFFKSRKKPKKEPKVVIADDMTQDDILDGTDLN